jgi:hypothetical protein
MKKYTLLFFILLSANCYSQITFKRYFKDILSYSNIATYFYNNEYYFFGPNSYPSTEVKIDSLGNLSLLNFNGYIFTDTSTTYPYVFNTVQSNNIIYYYLLNSYRCQVMRRNLTDNSYKISTIDSSGFGGSPFSNHLFYDHTKIFFLNHFRYLPRNSAVIVFDDSLSIVNSFILSDSTESFSGFHAPDATSYLTGINKVDSVASIARFDTSGNVLWCNQYLPNKPVILGSMRNANNTFTYYGYEDSSASNNNNSLFLFTIDTTGNVSWSKGINHSVYHPLYQWRLSPFGDAHPVMCKTHDDGFLMVIPWVDVGASDLLLIKFDSNGDTIWTVAHGGVYTGEVVYSVLETPDHGFIIKAGTTAATTAQGPIYNVYIIKTDSSGHTSTFCDERYMPVTVSSKILNPMPSTLQIQNYTPVLGMVPTWAPGIDSLLPIYDACVLTPQGIENKEAVVSIAIYPNPSTGIFNLEFEDATVKEIEVYTMQGRSVYKARVNSQTTSINLAHLSAGLYYVQATAAQGTGTVKLVKE